MSRLALSTALSILALSCSGPQRGAPPAQSDPDRTKDGEECPCRSKQQAASHLGGNPSAVGASCNDDAHVHSSMAPSSVASDIHRKAVVVPHTGLQEFENHGNALVGIATPSLGAESAEVWRSSVAVGSRTPSHTHTTEEIFIVLSGRGRVHVGDDVIDFQAPATVIAPAGREHFVENTGDVPTDSIVVVGRASEIRDASGEVMNLPWRR